MSTTIATVATGTAGTTTGITATVRGRQGRPVRGNDPRISIVIPAMNEARNLKVILPELTATATYHQIILVDGGSHDDTIAVARDLIPTITVVQQTRRGKGNALAAGFAAVTGDIVIMFDADGSADPTEIPHFVQALLAGADFAKGTRFTTGAGSADITPIRHLGNKFLNTVMNLAFKTRFTDLCYGYNAFWADMTQTLDLPDHTTPTPTTGAMVWGDGFEIETLINCRIAAAGATITEVASTERLRIYGESNLNAITDGLRVLTTLHTEHTRARTTRTTQATARTETTLTRPATTLAA